jgi:hypothetical protein
MNCQYSTLLSTDGLQTAADPLIACNIVACTFHNLKVDNILQYTYFFSQGGEIFRVCSY